MTTGRTRRCGAVTFSVSGIVLATFASASFGQDFADARTHQSVGPERPQALLEEIVVTARKRQENLQSTPIAITAFSADTLQQLSASSIRDIGSFAPNLVATQGPTSNLADANFYVRGVGQEDSNAARDPGVGVYLDGVYIGRTSGAALESLDVERIEVLRGPQGTLFGRNTIGGAVSIVTTEPDGELAGKAQLTVGERERIDAKAVVRFPIVADRLAGSIALTSRNQDGWGRSRVYDRTLGDTDVLAGRGKLAWGLGSDSFKALLSYDYTRTRNTNPPDFLAAVTFTNADGGPQTSPFGVPLPSQMAAQVCPTRHCLDTYGSNDPRTATDVWGGSLTLSWSLAAFTVKSISAYRELDQLSNRDFDASSFVFYDWTSRTGQRQFSQELQLGGAAWNQRLDWLLGLYYFKEEVSQRTSINFGGEENRLTPGVPPDPRTLTTNQFIFPKDENLAAFAQATFDITERLSFTGGVRLTSEKKSMEYDIFIDNRRDGGSLAIRPPGIFFPPTLLPVDIPRKSKTWEPVTWRAGLEYQAGDAVLLYGSVATGFRSGGFNGRPTSPAEATAFDPERTLTYEIGIKSELFNGTTRLNAAVFYTDYEDIQVLVPTGTFFAFANAKARNQGMEIELLTEPVAGLRLSASAGYLDSEIRSSPSAALRPGEALSGAPKWSLSAGPQYTVELGTLGTIGTRFDYAYRAATKFFNTSSALSTQPGYGVTNARVWWESASRNLRVAAYGLNVFDKKYLNFGSNSLDSFGVADGEPAPLSEYGIDVSMRF